MAISPKMAIMKISASFLHGYDAPAVCPNAPKTSKEELSLEVRQMDDINSNFSPSSYCNLFKQDRSFPTYRAHFPSTITSASLNSMILTRGPCRPSSPFEEDESGRPIFIKKHYFYFSTGNHVENTCSCASHQILGELLPHLLVVSRQDKPNFKWQWIDGILVSVVFLVFFLKILI